MCTVLLRYSSWISTFTSKSRLKEPTRSQTTPTSRVNMAALMRGMRVMCSVLEPTLTIRINNSYVRTVRYRPSTISSSSSSEEEVSRNLESGVKPEQVHGAEGLQHTHCPSAQQSMAERNSRDVGDQPSESHHEKTTSKRASPALSSKPPGFLQMERLHYEKAQPGDRRVL